MVEMDVLVTLIVVGFVVAIALLSICANCKRQKLLRRQLHQRRRELRRRTLSSGVSVIADGCRIPDPSHQDWLHWKPPAYDEVAELPSYEDAIRDWNNPNRDTTHQEFNNMCLKRAGITPPAPQISGTDSESSDGHRDGFSDSGIVNRAYVETETAPERTPSSSGSGIPYQGGDHGHRTTIEMPADPPSYSETDLHPTPQTTVAESREQNSYL